MAANPVVLILGSGPRVGAAVAQKFASSGYRVAVTSRKGTGGKTAEGYLSVKADFTKPESIPAVFAAVRAEFDSAPSVVIYNAATLTPPPDKDALFSIPVDSVASDLNVNTVSPYVAAQQAVAGWATLPADAAKTFIYTGNILNVSVVPLPLYTTLGIGKAGSGFWIGVADGTYSKQGYRFFYADERKADGGSVGSEIDGPAHADFYAQLANREGEVPWLATFVKGKGYVKF
ncbi:putative short-chain dehydrogenase reductase SDR [Rosellinia necatrix]|uniref:Putative short-chain dehydrogenase reductase SDR n=1 Tax=Rosellinia necatrix TaxID=77044 RepID=A0A1W2TCG7_ROSNE|nr:putative short-chain dehydrogenase reductase SDR [Rosellinia necatrix]